MDELSLSHLGASALTEGIKFLYAQAGEVLRRRRDRDAAPIVLAPQEQSIIEEDLAPLEIDERALARLEPDIRSLRSSLSEYADEIDVVSSDSVAVIDATDALRRALEAVFHHTLTFRGESRDVAGPTAGVEMDVDEVAGYVAAVVARAVEGGHIRAAVTAKRVEEGGRLVGLEVDQFGGDRGTGRD
jgi:hypothetical protein